MLQPFSEMPIWGRLVFKEQVESLYYWDMYVGNPAYGMLERPEDYMAWPDIRFKDALPMFFKPSQMQPYLDGIYDVNFASVRSIHEVTVKGFKRCDRLSSMLPENQLIVNFSMDWIVGDSWKTFDYQFLVTKS